VGKSRLMYEFVHSHHLTGWRVLESASVSYGKATPYLPVLDLLKRYVHVEESDDLRTIRAKVTGQVLTLDEALQEIIPALLSLLDALLDDSPFLMGGNRTGAGEMRHSKGGKNAVRTVHLQNATWCQGGLPWPQRRRSSKNFSSCKNS
jgi:hypothetical protein